MRSNDMEVGSLLQVDVAGSGSEGTLLATPVRVKTLTDRDRRKLLMHYLELGKSDRLLRFGSVLQDALITRYVQGIQFERDMMLGVFDLDLQLVGVGHLAFAPRDSLPTLYAATERERIAEFGVSVSKGVRNLGIGSKLFARAAFHCRKSDVDTLFMNCLATNMTMIHIAKKAGMEIRRDRGQTYAYLKLMTPSRSESAAAGANANLSNKR